MAALIPEGIPQCWTRGETVQWYENHTRYLPTDGWSLSVTLVQSDDVQTVAGADNGDGRYLVALTPAESQAFQVGLYRYQVRVTDGTDKHTVQAGLVDVLEGFEGVSSGHDARSHSERVLDAINAVVEGKASTDQQNLAVGGRSLSRYSWLDLMEIKREFEWRVRREHDQARVAAGLPSQLRSYVRFTR